jgi:hypothetical protein
VGAASRGSGKVAQSCFVTQRLEITELQKKPQTSRTSLRYHAFEMERTAEFEKPESALPAPAHIIQADTRRENVEAFSRAMKKHGVGPH